jgi:hypothetical protein
MHDDDFMQLRNALLTAVLDGNGTTTTAQRQAAFSNSGLAEPLKTLIAKVVDNSRAIDNGDIYAAKQAGLSEDQIFELVVCGAVGEANRQHDAALHALDRIAG